jgi:hypothetical protein
MKISITESAESIGQYDETKVMEYLQQMIDIANLFPLYEVFDDRIPDYEPLLHIWNAKHTGKMLNLNHYDSGVIEALDTVILMWKIIEKDYSEPAKYAVNAYDSVIGEEVFEEVLPDEVFEEAIDEVIRDLDFEGDPSREETLQILMNFPFIVHEKPEVVKLQNFIRLNRIAHNMRYIAYFLYKRKNDSPPLEMTIAYNVEWQDIFYYIPGREVLKRYPFSLICKHQNNRETGRLQPNLSFMEWVLSKIDILQIKICGYCLKIFFAEPRNKKYCSKKCNDLIKSQRHYRKKKLLASGESEEFFRTREALLSLVKKMERRGISVEDDN